MLFCCSAIAIFVLFPDVVTEWMKRAIGLCTETLIPTLFPFMVISEILVGIGTGRMLSRVADGFMRRMFGVSGACAGALLLGILCGFPVGAKTAASLFEYAQITKEDAESVNAFCNYPSPAFVIFVIGQGLFGSVRLGWMIYAVLIASGLGYGIIRSVLLRKKRRLGVSSETMFEQPHHQYSLPEIFTRAVSGAARSMFSVCAFVTFFCALTGSLSALLGDIAEGTISAVLFSFFELTSGASAASKLAKPMQGAIICAAAAGWSGVSVHMQIFTLTRTSRDRLSLSPYLLAKLINAVCAAAGVCAIFMIFPSLIPTESAATDAFFALSYGSVPLKIIFNLFFISSLPFCMLKKLDRRRRI